MAPIDPSNPYQCTYRSRYRLLKREGIEIKEEAEGFARAGFIKIGHLLACFWCGGIFTGWENWPLAREPDYAMMRHAQ